MGDNLEKLYEKYNILSEAKENVSKHSTEYIESFEGTKGNESEKMLTAQILSKFFKNFPTLQEQALNALLDLCEDEEPKIRSCSMRYLVSICKDAKDHLPKVTDILAQMMQLEEQRDHTTASWCLMQLWKEDSSNVLRTLFQHIRTLDSHPARVKLLEFLQKHCIKNLKEQSAEIEKIVVDESKKNLQQIISSDELTIILTLLKDSSFGKTTIGQQELVRFIGETLELDREVDFLEKNTIDKIILATKHALLFLNAKNESTKFVAYYCDQVLPQWEKISLLENSDSIKLHLLRNLAELSTNCGKFENPSLHVVQIFDKLKLYMPTPPEDADVYKMPNLEFSYVECLLYSFHRLARQCPDFLTHDTSVLKDFRGRLVYFSRGVQGCHKVLNNRSLKNIALSKIVIVPAMLNNINILIKDLFYQPPMYKAAVTLSFKTEVIDKEPKTVSTTTTTTTTSGTPKRHVPITFDNGSSNAKQSRTNRPGENLKLYTPPSGKFSNNFQNYDRANARNTRGRGLRGGRGLRRNWRN